MLTIIPTVDVEGMHGMRPFAQMVLGEVDGSGECWGIDKIAAVCARHEAPATFFVDVYEHVYWGEDPVREVCRRLRDGGFDVQLHTHPSWRDDPNDFTWLRELKAAGGLHAQAKDFMVKLDLREQVEMLRHGIEKLADWTGKRPVVHRSGGYSINDDTVRALAEVGIPMDSSMYQGHPHSHRAWTCNAVTEREGILELPVTQMNYDFVLPGIGRIYRKRMKTDLDTCSLTELKAYVTQAKANGVRVMNLFMHSYSLLDFDADYTRFRPEQADAEKLDRFLGWAQQQEGVRVMDCAGMLARYRAAPEEFAGPDEVPSVPVNRKIMRLAAGKLINKGQQLIRRLVPLDVQTDDGSVRS